MKNIKVLIVIVLYKTKIENCIAYNSIKNEIKYFPNMELLLYNNSIENKIESNNGEYIYNAVSNNMLFGAYNYTYYFAKENDFDWLVLLDQDSNISLDYLNEVNKFVNNKMALEIAVPILKANNKILSPFKYNINKGHFLQNFNLTKLEDNECLTAFNSGVVVKVTLITEFNGFSPDYPLDYLDFWYFKRIFELSKRVYILNCQIEHSLSLEKLSTEMTISRYLDFMRAEKLFIKSFDTKVKINYRVRLLMRALKQFVIIRSANHGMITLKHLLKK